MLGSRRVNTIDYQVFALASLLVSLIAGLRGKRLEAVPGVVLGFAGLVVALMEKGLSPGVVAAACLLGFSVVGVRFAVRESSIATALGMVALLAAPAGYQLDPRGGTILALAALLVSLGGGIAVAASLYSGKRAMFAAAALLAVSLMLEGYWLLSATEAPTPLADALFSTSLLGLTLLAYKGPGRMVASIGVFAAAALLVAGAAPYVKGGSLLAAAVLAAGALFPAVVGAGKRLGLGPIDRTELAASVASVAMALAGPLAGLLYGQSVYVHLSILESLVPLPSALLAFKRRELLQGILFAGAAAAMLVAVLIPYTVVVQTCTLTPEGLGWLAPAPKPNQEVIHDFYIVYLGAKNASIAYSILEPKLGKKEALRLARFFYAISIAAKEHGVRDPYNLTQLMHPEKLPTLRASLDCRDSKARLELLPRLALCPSEFRSEDFNTTLEPPPFASIQAIRLARSEACKLAHDYLIMVSNPELTDGDALRFAIYTAMLVSWGEVGNASRLAKLIFGYAFNNTVRVEPVEAELVLRVRWLPATAYYAGVVLLVVMLLLTRRSH